MHRDQKIGLALGVLLIGAVAAFFFRNERSTMDGVPVISDVVELDAVIAEKNFRPYLGDASRSSDRTVTRPVNDTLIIPPLNDPWEGSASGKMEAPVTPTDNPKQAMNRASDETTQDLPAIPWPDDVLEVESVAPKQTGSSPAANRTQGFRSERQDQRGLTEATGDSSFVNQSGMDRYQRSSGHRPGDAGSSDSEAVTMVTHVVKKGETLSSLSQKYLGRESRYLEIFDANRDQLRDAHGVRTGMTLKIPVTRNSRNIAETPRQTRDDPASPAPANGEKRLFVPFKPRPANAATWGPTTELPEAAPRRLSQQPPESSVLR